jgi:hypothetical protein
MNFEDKYYTIRKAYAKEVEKNKKERETRWNLLLELKRMTELRDQLQEDFNALLDQKSNPQGSQK